MREHTKCDESPQRPVSQSFHQLVTNLIQSQSVKLLPFKENDEFWVKVFLRLNNVLESFAASLRYVKYILPTGFLENRLTTLKLKISTSQILKMSYMTRRLSSSAFFLLNKNLFYKNIEADICD